ncbi:MAG: alpha/beta fold hydrolase [Candidatus Entotheonellia bacterium]
MTVLPTEPNIYTPAQAEIPHAGIPDSALVILDESGHVPHLETPEAFSRRFTAGWGQPHTLRWLIDRPFGGDPGVSEQALKSQQGERPHARRRGEVR